MPHSPSGASARPSPHVLIKSLELSALHTSRIQDMVRLNGNRSNNSNINVGGNTLDIGPQVAVVRGVGLIRSIDDINNTMLTQTGGTPVLVRDIATVTVENKPRLGIAGRDNQDDIVQGTVLMRRGEKSTPTINRVEAEIERINHSNVLPADVKIERIYDRKDLIEITTRTVLHNMVFGIILIFILQWCS